jgi:hypothetical protein
MKAIVSIVWSWILVSGYWMILDVIIRVLLDIQHQVSSIQHLPGKHNRLTHVGYAR